MPMMSSTRNTDLDSHRLAFIPTGIGTYDGDKIVVDRSLEARHGMIIVAIVNGEHTIKRLHITSNGIELWPENPCYSPIRLKEHEELVVFGVVVGVVRKMQA